MLGYLQPLLVAMSLPAAWWQDLLGAFSAEDEHEATEGFLRQVALWSLYRCD